MHILRLTLKKKWFDMTSAEIKLEEYREIKPYWISRLCEKKPKSKQDLLMEMLETHMCSVLYKFKPYTHAEVKLGYARDAPTILIEIKGIRIGTAVPEWSDNWQGNVFVIEWGKIVERRNFK